MCELIFINIHPFNPPPGLTELKATLWNRVSPPITTVCMYLTVSLFLRIELRSLGKIEEGEELTVSYVDFMNLSEERRRLLKTQYYFDCTCEHCKNHTKDDLKMAGAEVDGVKVCLSLWTHLSWFNENNFILHKAGKDKTLSVHLVPTHKMIRTDEKHEKQSCSDYFKQR